MTNFIPKKISALILVSGFNLTDRIPVDQVNPSSPTGYSTRAGTIQQLTQAVVGALGDPSTLEFGAGLVFASPSGVPTLSFGGAQPIVYSPVNGSGNPLFSMNCSGTPADGQVAFSISVGTNAAGITLEAYGASGSTSGEIKNQLFNSSVAGGTRAATEILVGATNGEALVRCGVPGGQNWAFGKNASDNFVIAAASTLGGSGQAITIDKTTLGITTPNALTFFGGPDLQSVYNFWDSGAFGRTVFGIQGTFTTINKSLMTLNNSGTPAGLLSGILCSCASTGDLRGFYLQQNSTGSAVMDWLLVGATAAGNGAYSRYAVNGGTSWVAGLDPNDGSAYKINAQTNMAGTPQFKLQTDGTLFVNGGAHFNGNVAIGANIDTHYLILASANLNDPASFNIALSASRGTNLTANNTQPVTGVSGGAAFSSGAFSISAAGPYIGMSGVATMGSAGGTLAVAQGAEAYVYNTSTTGVVTNGYGFAARAQVLNAGGSITDFRAFYAGTGFNNGTIGTWYGLYIDTPPTATTKFGIFINAAIESRFGGTISVGNGFDVAGRNAANNANLRIGGINASDEAIFGPNGSIRIAAGSITDALVITAAGTPTSIKAFRCTPIAVAALPTPAEGMIAAVNDSNSVAIGATVAGGGANHVLVWYNNTAWKIFAA